jgi:pimeloyl-ACP methyl ester carboxylesterase
MTANDLSRAVFTIALVSTLLPSAVYAQEQPVVFVHGWNSGPDSWREAAERLRSRAAIVPHRYQTASMDSIGDQANELQAQYPAQAMPPVTVGHSNGGLVSRQWSRQRSIHGIVTIGTPHTGAPLLRNRVALARYYQQGYARVRAAAFSLAPRFDEWDWVGAPAAGFVLLAGRLTYSGLWGLAITTGFDQLFPVHRDMAPGSALLTELNSDANLTRERLNVPHRIGIVSVHPRSARGGPLRLAGHAAGDVASGIIFVTAVALDYWGMRILAGADPSDPVAYQRALDRAFALMNLAGWTWDFEPAWCSAITSTTSRPECETSDGIVPGSRQVYPGASQVVLPTGPVHTQETSQSDEALFAALTVDVGIPARSGSQ